MIICIISFLIGDLWIQTFTSLPSKLFIFTLILITALVYFILRKHARFAFIPLAFTCGFLWTFWYASSVSSWALKHEWEGKPLNIVGHISSLPVAGKFGENIEFHVEKLNYLTIDEYPNAVVKLTLPQKSLAPIKAGDKWQFRARLKRIHSTQNPGAFDYEAWAFQKGIRASGVVIDSQNNKIISHEQFKMPLARLRQYLQEKILLYSPHTQTSPWLMALMIGERNGIAKEDWQVLRNTGTNHLMAIGGLHIGILASFVHYIIAWLWRRIPFCVFFAPSQHIGACAALFAAIIYSSLSGFSIPTQRASIMLCVFVLTILSNRKINPWNAWSLALLCVLMINPLCVLTESIWLSFGTIALIIYCMSHRLFPSGFWWKWGRIQWVIGVGLMPLTLALFQECSLVSFLANSIAIPWLGITILPLCFLSTVFLTFSPNISSLLLLSADKSLTGLWAILSWLAQIQFSSWQIAIPNQYLIMCLVIGFLILLLPAGLPGRWLGIVWVMPVLLYQPIKPKPGEYWLTLLDVGQGLSVVIQTKRHTMVYDAGPKFNASFDMGENVVLPYLRTLKTKNIDMLVISHGDNDHIGGAAAILSTFIHTPVQTSVPEKIHSSHTDYCLSGDTWEWDQVRFTFLYPMDNKIRLGNDSSCVLLIDNGKHKVLLTGDIEKYAENALLTSMPEKLSANIIVAPHHGSKTSGWEKFISAVHPQIVLYATGYMNRYHFPHLSVVKAYEKIHAQPFNTVDSGAIQFKIPQGGVLQPPERYRVTNKKYWFDS